MYAQTCMGISGLEKGARVQMMLSLESGLEVKKEQASTTESPCTTSRLDSLMVTLSATVPEKQTVTHLFPHQLFLPLFSGLHGPSSFLSLITE